MKLGPNPESEAPFKRRNPDAQAQPPTGPAEPQHRRRRQHRSENAWSGSQRMSLRWLLAGALCLAVLGFFLMKQLKGSSEGVRQPKDDGVREAVAGKIFDPGRTEDWKGALPIEVAEKFTQAQTVAERLVFVRDPQRVRPALEEFFREGPGAGEKVAVLIPLGLIQTTQFTFQRFEAKMKDGSSRLLCVVLIAEKGAKVDFESYARHGSESWADLLSGKALESEVVRVFVKAENYYNHGFADEGKWRHFAATTPDVNMPLDFYVARGSEADEHLVGIASRRQMRATLAIRSVAGSFENRQFEVTKVLGPGWVIKVP